jgi:hypothetical protein
VEPISWTSCWSTSWSARHQRQTRIDGVVAHLEIQEPQIAQYTSIAPGYAAMEHRKTFPVRCHTVMRPCWGCDRGRPCRPRLCRQVKEHGRRASRQRYVIWPMAAGILLFYLFLSVPKDQNLIGASGSQRYRRVTSTSSRYRVGCRPISRRIPTLRQYCCRCDKNKSDIAQLHFGWGKAGCHAHNYFIFI